MAERLRAEAKLEKAIVQLSDEIAERKQAQVELKEQAITDFLTGLFNRRYFFELAEKEFSKSVRYERPLAVAIFDLDLFKVINDTYGHDVGDQALKQIADLLRDTIRDVDVSARYGGEEFAGGSKKGFGISLDEFESLPIRDILLNKSVIQRLNGYVRSEYLDLVFEDRRALGAPLLWSLIILAHWLDRKIRK